MSSKSCQSNRFLPTIAKSSSSLAITYQLISRQDCSSRVMTRVAMTIIAGRCFSTWKTSKARNALHMTVSKTSSINGLILSISLPLQLSPPLFRDHLLSSANLPQSLMLMAATMYVLRPRMIFIRTLR